MLTKEEQLYYKLLGIDPSNLFFLLDTTYPSLILLYTEKGLEDHPRSLCQVRGSIMSVSVQIYEYEDRLNYAQLVENNTQVLVAILKKIILDPQRLLKILETRKRLYQIEHTKNTEDIKVLYILDEDFDINTLIGNFVDAFNYHQNVKC